MSILSASAVSTASLGSHPRIDVKSASEVTVNNRKTLIEIAFPYLDIAPTAPQEVNYDAYFDELDAREKAREDAEKAASSVGLDAPK